MRREGLLCIFAVMAAYCDERAKSTRFGKIPRRVNAEAVPRHSEIANLLAKRICRKLSIPNPPGQVKARVRQGRFPSSWLEGKHQSDHCPKSATEKTSNRQPAESLTDC